MAPTEKKAEKKTEKKAKTDNKQSAKRVSEKTHRRSETSQKAQPPTQETVPETAASSKSSRPRRAKQQFTSHLNTQQARDLRQWIHIDAKGQTLGRLCATVATYLRGKHKPEYSPHLDVGDYVVITNAKEIHLSGNKWSQKTYYHHTGYMGHLRSKTATDLKQKKSGDLIKIAVKGMLPHSTLGRNMLKKLKVFTGETHTLQSKQPKTITLNTNLPTQT